MRQKAAGNTSAARLLRLEEMLEGTDRGSASRMAARYGVSIQQWWNITRGGLPLSKKMEGRIIMRTPGMSGDWLQWGITRGLSLEMATKLRIGQGEADDGPL